MLCLIHIPLNIVSDTCWLNESNNECGLGLGDLGWCLSSVLIWSLGFLSRPSWYLFLGPIKSSHSSLMSSKRPRKGERINLNTMTVLVKSIITNLSRITWDKSLQHYLKWVPQSLNRLSPSSVNWGASPSSTAWGWVPQALLEEYIQHLMFRRASSCLKKAWHCESSIICMRTYSAVDVFALQLLVHTYVRETITYAIYAFYLL